MDRALYNLDMQSGGEDGASSPYRKAVGALNFLADRRYFDLTLHHIEGQRINRPFSVFLCSLVALVEKPFYVVSDYAKFKSKNGSKDPFVKPRKDTAVDSHAIHSR